MNVVRCLRRRWSNLLPALILTLVGSVALLPSTAGAQLAQCDSVGSVGSSTFQSDGNFYPFDLLGVDWTDIFDANRNPIIAETVSNEFFNFQDPHWAGSAKDPTSFSGHSNKNDDDISELVAPWSYANGSGPQKNDLTDVLAYTDVIFGDRWFFLGANTRATNGDSHFDVEFLRAGLSVTEDEVIGLGANGGRTIGDFIISVDFEQGGAIPVATLRTWDGSNYVEATPVADAIFVCTNLENTAAPPWGAIDGSGDPTDTVIPLQFVEVFVNLAAFGIGDAELCGANSVIMYKTRASDSFTSELKDFVFGQFTIRTPPEVTVMNKSVCEGEDAMFCAPVSALTGGGPHSFLWTGPNGFSSTDSCISIVDVSMDDAGDYCVEVTDAFGCTSGQVCGTLAVTPTPTCDIVSGPSFLCPGASATYSATVDNCTGTPVWNWSWTGNATKISGGGTSDSSIELRADDCNGFTVKLTVDCDCPGVECTFPVDTNDTTDPVLVGCPNDVTVQCLADVPAAPTVTATDNCDGDITPVFEETEGNGTSCDNTIVRTWTATDFCGNSVSCSQTITINDTTDPVLSGCPSDVTVECLADVPAPANVTATDNCDGDITPVLEETPGDGTGCNATIVRTWTATDECGNSVSCSQTITINDTTDPVLSGCPSDVTVQCLADVPSPANVTATDNCDGDITPVLEETEGNGTSCDNTIVRTWTATDECGNSVSCSQTITINDTTNPTITCAADKTQECGTDPVFDDPTANDNCDANPVIMVVDTTVEDLPNGTATTRTWKAVDDCDNESATCSQTITIECEQECCWMTSGGFLNADMRQGRKDNNFGGNAGPPPSGSWQHQARDHDTGENIINFHSNDVTVLACGYDAPGPCHPDGDVNVIVFGGPGTYNMGKGKRAYDGYFEVTVIDHGEPGREGWQAGGCGEPDFYSFTLWEDNSKAVVVYTTDVPGEDQILDGGNLQVRTCKNKDQSTSLGASSTSPSSAIQPVKFGLFPAFPNPAQSSTNIRFALAEQSKVRLTVYDIAGRVVTRLVDDVLGTGYVTVKLDTDVAKMASGIYFYRMEAVGLESGQRFVQNRKMVLLR